jgi:predicted HD phosphohydrolase
LQAAWFAREESAPPVLIVATLLHDIGHLVEDVSDDLGDWTKDAHHEETGAGWLEARMRPEVAGPVRLHVPAKRYLCATDQNYVAMLSHASMITLKLQGGPMVGNELIQFETEPHYKEAVRLRRWDDQGKIVGLKTPGLAEYRELIEQLALRAQRYG